MKIGILGWGSLLWEGGAEFDRWREDWRNDGPTLPIEFSRISETRLGSLTLVVDTDHGTPTVVAWCLSRRSTLDDAVCDLRSREGTTVENVGRCEARGSSKSNDPLVAWALGQNLDAVIWTALKSNFQKERGEPFSVSAAVAYLKSLGPEGKAKAAEYVWRAPNFVNTPVRSALQREPWFVEQPANIRMEPSRPDGR